MPANLVNTLNQIMEDGLSRALIHHTTQDDHLNGRTITLNKEELLNFGSCAYLGIEHHPSLKQGVVDAVTRFGTQFSSSRTYASLGLYEELEERLMQLFGKPTIVTASTTLGHLATIPIIVEEGDAVILDMQVHNSVQMAIQLLKAEGIPITLIKHNDMDMLEQKILQLQSKHRKVWFFADGVYSMYGDYAPLDRLVSLMNKYDCFHLYIDDAHGMSWTGKNGCGYVRSQIDHHPKMVLAGSLNKSFASAGGMIVFPTPEMAQKVRNCGGTLIFCGPIQPPMLGAAVASVKLHMSDQIIAYQKRLKELIQYTNDRIRQMGLPQFVETDSPLFFIPVGLPKITREIIQRMLNDGVYVNAASFPATPMKRGGVRFMINGNMFKKDIDHLVESLAYHYPRVLAETGSSPKKVAKTFGIPIFHLPHCAGSSSTDWEEQPTDKLRMYLNRHITEIEAAEWDYHMSAKGNFNHSHLRLVESVFTKQTKAENNWDFQYVRIKDQAGETILSTFYTVALIKDDMFAPAAVSIQIEEERKRDPYYLNSTCVILGSMITKGNHLFLNREHPLWKEALNMLIKQMQQTVEQSGATQLMLREFEKDQDEELKAFLLDLGLTELSVPSSCTMDQLTWQSQEEYLQRLGGKYRYNVRKEILPFLSQFELSTEKPKTELEIRECYQLYCQVHQKAFAFNVHRLPYDYFEKICRHPNYDIVRLYKKEEVPSGVSRKAVGVMFSYLEKKQYQAMIVGLDYDYVRSHHTYKQMLYHTVMRARALSSTHLDLAFTAELEKKKVGARPVPMVAFVQVMDFFNHASVASYGCRKGLLAGTKT